MPLAVALPGRRYPVGLPAVASVTGALTDQGYDVRGVAWTAPDPIPGDAAEWVVDRMLEALDGVRPDVVVAKSLGTLAASYVGEQGWPAIWVTPVLQEAVCSGGVRANPAPQLLVCGAADPLHDADVAADLVGATGCDLLEVPGVDHALSSTGDATVAPDVVRAIAAAATAFVGRLR